MTCHVGSGVIVCTPSPWRPVLDVECPWCLEKRRCLEALVYNGWCGSDFICGTCGSFWSSDDERIRKISEAERDENVALVASVADPACWECYDRGFKPMGPCDDERERCACLAGRVVCDCGGDPSSFCCEARR